MWVNRGPPGLTSSRRSPAARLDALRLVRQRDPESEKGLYNRQVDVSYRWAMGWFIFSETLFFAAFFAALFYLRWHAAPDLSSGDSAELWPGYQGAWRTTGPSMEGTLVPMRAVGVPLINTLILLTSAATLVWAHWGLKKGSRGQLKLGLALTIALGIVFLGLQLSEHYHAYTAQGLKLGSGTYGATFFMLTGFHGVHVAVGATILIVIFTRALRGDFTPTTSSRSRPPPGTGSSWTSCGYCCSRWCTGYETRAKTTRGPGDRRRSGAPLVLEHPGRRRPRARPGAGADVRGLSRHRRLPHGVSRGVSGSEDRRPTGGLYRQGLAELQGRRPQASSMRSIAATLSEQTWTTSRRTTPARGKVRAGMNSKRASLPWAFAGVCAALALARPALAAEDAGKKKADAVCAACHGPEAPSPTPRIPAACRPAIWIPCAIAVRVSQGNARESPDGAIAKPLTDMEIRDLAAYFSTQPWLAQR